MNQSDATELGVRWATQGWHAFPVAVSWDETKQSTNKRPLTKNGFHDASNDRERVRRMFNAASIRPGEEFAVGLCPGKSGKMALDVDIKGGQRGDEELAALEERYGKLPTGPVVVTASGGLHIILDKGDRVVDNTDLAPDCVEVRADSGFIVAPGTTTPWGSWTVDEVTRGTPIPPAPEWIFEVLAGNGAKTGSASTGGGGHWQPVDEGTLHDADRAALVALKRLGGHGEYLSSDGSIQVTRPGKAAGSSASVGFLGPGVVKVWSGNWPGLQQNAVYDADALNRIADQMDAGESAEPPVQAATTVDTTPAFAVYDPSLAFPLEVFPAAFADYVAQAAVSTSVDVMQMAALSLLALGTAIGNSRAVRLRRKWAERSNLWVVIVCKVGMRKSSAGSQAIAPLRAIQSELDALWLSEVEQWELMGPKGSPKPVHRQMLVDDITIEALGREMLRHPRCTLQYTDELSGWLASMGQYKPGASGDRQKYLSAWSREPFRSSRIGRDTVIVPHPHLSIGGTAQPDVIQPILYLKDGFGHRFLACVPKQLATDVYSADITPEVDAAYDALVRGLYVLECATPAGDPLYLKWADGAHDAWLRNLDKLCKEREAPEALSNEIKPIWSKAEGHMARFIVILTATWAVAEGRPEIITPEIVAGAERLVRFFCNQALFVHEGDIGASPLEYFAQAGPGHEEALLSFLRKVKRTTLRDVLKHVKSWRELGHGRAVDVMLAMERGGVIVVVKQQVSRGVSYGISLP